jgi:hypothetical protein
VPVWDSRRGFVAKPVDPCPDPVPGQRRHSEMYGSLGGGPATGIIAGAAAGTLAFTGAPIGWLIAVGQMLVVTGLFLIRMSRMRTRRDRVAAP